MFCVISGYLTKPVAITTRVKKLAKRLFPYYCFSAIIIVLLSIKLQGINPICDWLLGMNNSTSYYSIVSGIGPMWYLPAIFFASFFEILIIRFVNSFFSISVSLIVCVIGALVSKIFFLPFQLDNALVLSVFVIVGYFFKKYRLFDLKIKIQYVVLILFIGLTVSYMMGGQSYASRVYPLFPLCVFVSIVLVYAIMWLIKNYCKESILTKYLKWLGRHSLEILTTHTIEYMFIMPLWNNINIFSEKHIDSVVRGGVSLALNSILIYLILRIYKRLRCI
jgi:hypothetical protein